MSLVSQSRITSFRRTVWAAYRAHGRHELPWRKTTDPYKILVSEVMLQQTQVERVVPFYIEFVKKFPTAQKLAAAPLSAVLKSWQGLGYNRRALMLHAAAKELATTPHLRTRFNLVERLEELPGVGPYTARAVAAFAWNADVIVIETNIRTAVIQHFFPQEKSHSAKATKGKKVSDKEIEKILKGALPKGRSREWYSALMDYGAHLKRTGVSHNGRSDTYARQARFAGSPREARGAILRELAREPGTRAGLVARSGLAAERIASALDALCAEGLVRKRGARFALAD